MTSSCIGTGGTYNVEFRFWHFGVFFAVLLGLKRRVVSRQRDIERDVGLFNPIRRGAWGVDHVHGLVFSRISKAILAKGAANAAVLATNFRGIALTDLLR